MAITNQSVLDNAATTFRDAFDEIFAAGMPGYWQTFTQLDPTDSELNEIDILETMPVLREWLGEKQYEDIFASSFTATVRRYEKSMEFDRLKVQADRTGMTARRIARFLSAGGAAGQGYDRLATAALIANATGYDGVALFSASHPRGPGGATQSNTSSTALSFAQHEAVQIAGGGLRDANGEPLGISYDTLMVGPKLAKIGKEITQSTERQISVSASGVEATSSVVAATTIPNVFGGGDMTLIVNPRLVGTYDDYYYYIDTQRGPKPVMGYEFRAPEAVTQFNMDDEGRFSLDKLRCSVEADVVFTTGDWHVAFAGIL